MTDRQKLVAQMAASILPAYLRQAISRDEALCTAVKDAVDLLDQVEHDVKNPVYREFELDAAGKPVP